MSYYVDVVYVSQESSRSVYMDVDTMPERDTKSMQHSFWVLQDHKTCY